MPYRGGAQIVTDIVGNQLDLAMLVSISAIPNVVSKRMKAIAVTDDKRLGALPDVPAVAEATGMKGFDVVAWTGLFAPARTPAAVVDRLNRELNDVLASEEMRTKLGEQGAVPGSGTGPAFGAFIEREQGRYAHIVKAANIRE